MNDCPACATGRRLHHPAELEQWHPTTCPSCPACQARRRHGARERFTWHPAMGADTATEAAAVAIARIITSWYAAPSIAATAAAVDARS